MPRRRPDAGAEAEAVAGCCGGGGWEATGAEEKASRRRDSRGEADSRAHGNPPDLFARCDPRVGGLPKGPKIWSVEDWYGGNRPRKNIGIPPGMWGCQNRP